MSFLPFARKAALSFTTRQLSTRSSTWQKSRRTYIKPLLWSVGFASLVLHQAIRLDAGPVEDTFTDPATSIAFPTTLTIPAKMKLPTLSLVGAGVRTVSFLRIKVYSVGFYADLNNPNLKITADMTPEEKLDHIVRNTSCVIRIVPTRSTSYTHLRDAFMRSMQGRAVLGRKLGTFSEADELEAQSPLRKLKTLFPNSPLDKHTPMDIYLTAPSPGRPRALVFRDMGAIESDWVATEFVLAYFEGQGLSPPLKIAVTGKLESFTK